MAYFTSIFHFDAYFLNYSLIRTSILHAEVLALTHGLLLASDMVFIGWFVRVTSWMTCVC